MKHRPGFLPIARVEETFVEKVRRVLRGPIGGVLATVLLFSAVESWAQVGPGVFQIVRFWDGTAIVNAGDAANNAVRVNLVAGGGAGGGAAQTQVRNVGDSAWANVGSGASQEKMPVQIFGTGGNLAIVTNTTPGGSDYAQVVRNIPSGTQTTQQATIASANNDGACVSMTTTSAAILASFSTRRHASICSRATNTDLVFVKFGATATTSDYPLEIGQCINLGSSIVYTGAIDGRSNAGTQSVCVFEF